MPRRVTFFLELRIKAVFSDLQIHFRLWDNENYITHHVSLFALAARKLWTKFQTSQVWVLIIYFPLLCFFKSTISNLTLSLIKCFRRHLIYDLNNFCLSNSTSHLLSVSFPPQNFLVICLFPTLRKPQALPTSPWHSLTLKLSLYLFHFPFHCPLWRFPLQQGMNLSQAVPASWGPLKRKPNVWTEK